jgi:hypothetical protein
VNAAKAPVTHHQHLVAGVRFRDFCFDLFIVVLVKSVFVVYFWLFGL